MSLSSILQSVQKGTLKNVLTGAVVALTTGAISYTAFQSAVSALKGQTNSIPADIIAILHLSGVDIFMSTILAAIATTLTLNASKLSLTKLSK